MGLEDEFGTSRTNGNLKTYLKEALEYHEENAVKNGDLYDSLVHSHDGNCSPISWPIDIGSFFVATS